MQELGEKVSRLIEKHLIPLPAFELIPHIYEGKSLPAPNHMLHELIFKGSHQSYDSIVSKEQKKDYSFTLFEVTYLERTGNRIEPSDYISFGLATPEGNLIHLKRVLRIL